MEQKVIQIGNSVGIAIPSSLRKQLKIEKGDTVFLVATQGGEGFAVKKQSTFQSSSKKHSRATSKEFKKWLEGVLVEDAEILDELSIR